MFHWMLICHVILSAIVIPFGIMLHKKLYHNIKNEEHQEKGQIIQRIIKTYSILQCILWPLCLILSTPFLDTSILNKIAPTQKFYLLQISRFMSTFLRHFVGFHSLIVATCRYVFIVFNSKAERIGIARLRKFFISCSIQVPLLLTITEGLVFPAEDWMSHFRFSDSNLCQNISNSEFKTIQYTTDFSSHENLFYRSIQKYIPGILIGVTKVVVISIATIIYSNVAEGVMYGHIFLNIIRYHNLDYCSYFIVSKLIDFKYSS